MASKFDTENVFCIEDLLIEEDVWGFWDTRENAVNRVQDISRGTYVLVDKNRIFMLGSRSR